MQTYKACSNQMGLLLEMPGVRLTPGAAKCAQLTHPSHNTQELVELLDAHY